jgi:hypothetical protein
VGTDRLGSFVIPLRDVISAEVLLNPTHYHGRLFAFDIHAFSRATSTWRPVTYRFSSSDYHVCQQWVAQVTDLIVKGVQVNVCL